VSAETRCEIKAVADRQYPPQATEQIPLTIYRVSDESPCDSMIGPPFEASQYPVYQRNPVRGRDWLSSLTTDWMFQ